MHSGYGIAFDGGDWWSFSNRTVRNVIFSVLIIAHHHKNNFLILGLGPTFGINGSLVLIFTKTDIKFCLSLHYNVDNIYLFVNGKKIIKVDNKNGNFSTRFSLGSISDRFSVTELLSLEKKF